MKLLIIADTHYGVRGDNPHFYNYQKKFFDNVVFPYIERFKIKRLIHLGDLVDNRKSMNYLSMTRMEEDFIENIDIECDFIVGNHDSFYRNSLKINAMEEFAVGGVHDKVSTISIDGADICIVPWLCADNYEDSVARIRESTAKYCFGHLELKGFQNNNGMLSLGGEDRHLFHQFDKVLSGHFHKRSRQDNIHYVGSCFSFTWSDHNDYRGMAVFDTATGETTHFRNPYHIFSHVDYSGIDPDLSHVKDTYCRLNVLEKTNDMHLNDLVKKIEDIGVIDLTIDDRRVMLPFSPEKAQEGESLHSLIQRHIDSLALDNPLPIKLKLEELYSRAEGVR